MLPTGDEMSRGHVVVQSQNVSWKVMGRTLANTIMDTRLYQVEFKGGKVTKVTAIIIAGSMYIQ